MKKIAIIGAGNMGSAIASSIPLSEYKVVCTAATEKTLKRVSGEIPGIETTRDNVAAVKDADIIILAVKPYVLDNVLDELTGHVKENAIVISVATVMSPFDIEYILNSEQMSDPEDRKYNVFNVIPNTAIRCGKSVTFITCGSSMPKKIVDEVVALFERSGKTFVVPEIMLPVYTSLASCGIAYFLRFIRALAEGSVELGLKAGMATKIAALTAESAAALLADGSHPEAEIDKVTTPKGLTIKGLNALEEHGFNAAVIAALKASTPMD